MLLRVCCVFLLTITLITVTSAQDDDLDGTSTSYGSTITGQLNDRTPRQVYFFEGLRGERIAVRLRTTSGNLDPIMLVLDQQGNIIASRDDMNGGKDTSVELSIPRSVRYYVVVGRFGYGQGSTSGGYELSIERIGVSSESGSMLRYGDSVLNLISDMTPQAYYSFRAERGDIINIKMQRTSGNLDPYLQVVNSDSFVLSENDDIPGTNSLDAEIEALVIEETGVYVVVATRFGQTAGNSVGTFVLTIDEAENSGLGATARAALPLTPGEPVTGELTFDNFQQFYAFEARANDLISVEMLRGGNSNVDPLLVITDSNLQEIVENDDISDENQNARIEEFVIPADGTYYIIATRYQRASGSTSGGYELRLEYNGNVFDGVRPEIPTLRPGITVTGRIDDETPQVLYAFYGEELTTFTLSMNRGDGDLLPMLAILDDEQRVIVRGDNLGGAVARIDRFIPPRSGVYYVVATRAADENGFTTSAGSYLLVLAQRFD